jgi:hypothetical protein
MGLFSKNLDYSSGNGALPWLKEDAYSPISLPSSTVLPAPNFSLIDKEEKAGRRGYFLQLTEKNYLENQENPDVIKIVEKYLATLRSVMAPDLNSDATQTLGNHIACGIAAAKVEFDSTLQIEDKIHPSVSQSFFSLWMSSGQDSVIKQEFEGIENYSSLLYLATQIGYIAQRKNGNISVSEMFTNIWPLR